MSPVTLWQKIMAAFIFIIGIGVWISAQFILTGSTEGRAYSILLNESVSGLAPSSLVRYNGIEVGKVTKIRNDFDTNKVAVDVLITQPAVKLYSDRMDTERPNVILKQGTRAILTGSLVTGIQYIELTGGGEGCPPLQGKYIPAGKSGFSVFADQLDGFVYDLRKVFNDKNIQNLGYFIENLKKISENLNVALEDRPGYQSPLTHINEVLQNTREITGSESHEKIKKILENIEKLTDPKILQIDTFLDELKPKLINVASSLDTLIAEIRDVVNSHGRQQGDIASVLVKINNILGENRASLRSTIENLDSALTDTRLLVQETKKSINVVFHDLTHTISYLDWLLQKELPEVLDSIDKALKDFSDVLRLLKIKPNALMWGSGVQGR